MALLYNFPNGSYRVSLLCTIELKLYDTNFVLCTTGNSKIKNRFFFFFKKNKL